MTYYWYNRQGLFQIKKEKWQKNKNTKKRKYQRQRYHMNTDLNEKLKQFQRNYHDSKKKK